jgi:hypothetical protein
MGQHPSAPSLSRRGPAAAKEAPLMTMRTTLGHASLAIACVSMLSACSDTTISVRHDPPYRAEPHLSTISVTARSETGIKRIDVELLVGDLVACASSTGLPSMFPCRRRDAYWTTYTCNFDLPPISGEEPSAELPADVSAYPIEATCPVSRTLNALTLLTYRATVLDGSGRSTPTNYITYSGGAPPVAQPTVAPSFADVLRPVWLEFDDSSIPAENMASHVDVAFLPEVDWGADYRGFADSTGDIASHLVFEPLNGNEVPQVMADYLLSKRLFNYWVGPVGADADVHRDVCDLFSTGWVGAAQAVTDAQAIVHKIPFRDCSRATGWGTVTAEPNAYVTYAHESGHFLFSMGDEYQGAQGLALSDPPNNVATPEDCEQTASAYGFPVDLCVPIQSSPLWRITDGSPEIMAATLPFPWYDWQDTNNVLFQRRMAACLAGSCW